MANKRVEELRGHILDLRAKLATASESDLRLVAGLDVTVSAFATAELATRSVTNGED